MQKKSRRKKTSSMELLENDWYEIKENMLIDQVILKIDSQKKKTKYFLITLFDFTKVHFFLC